MSDPTNDRKLQHIRIIETDEQVDRRKMYFDDIGLIHRALPEVNLSEVDTSVTFMNRKLSFPLLISSMTGGEQGMIRNVNRNLAIAAEQAGVALAVGSQRVMFTHPESRASFNLRPHAPNTLLFSNIGAVQLNYGFTADMCREAMDVVGADALYLHLNPLQEAVQPEGDTNFAGLSARIADVAGAMPGPVVVKEVGAGISPADVELLIRAGVRYIDVAGAGGTSWSRIEHHRRATKHDDGIGMLFQDWGMPTPVALRQLDPYRDRVTLLASGGIRSGVDMVKAMILGASLCGLASPFLKPAMESPERVVQAIERLQSEFRTAMFLLGARKVADIFGHTSLIWKGV